MNKLIKISLIFFSVIAMLYITSTLFNFFGINFSSYSSYIIWFIGLLIFYLILPKKPDDLFNIT